MKPISFLFDQLETLSLGTELLEASDWSDEIASNSLGEMQNLIIKYESQESNIHDLEVYVHNELLKTNPKQRTQILVKMLKKTINKEKERLKEESN